jgi:3-hydroxyacyl-[acyl-carrier-protein] dehydratase
MINKKKAILTTQEIIDMLPQRYPFLFIDKVIQLIPGKSGTGIKNVTANEPYFQGHFPQKMIMPGVMIVECCAQLAGIVLVSEQKLKKQQVEYLASIQRFDFKGVVVPGNQLQIEASGFKFIHNLIQVTVQAKVDNSIVAKGSLIITNRTNNGVTL